MPEVYRAILKRRAAAAFMAEGTYARTLLVGALQRLEIDEKPKPEPKKAKR